MSRQFRSPNGRFIKGHITWNTGRNTVRCICKNCSKEFYPKDFVRRVYCSKQCYKMKWKPRSGNEHHMWKGGKKKYICSQCKRTFIPKSHGKEYSFCSVKCRGKYFSGEKQHNWKGGITEENHRIRTSTEYLTWRLKVLQRDYFKCINCGYRSKGKNNRDVVVDHIKPFSLYPELRLEVSNGRTLCRKCDWAIAFNYKHYLKENGKAVQIYR